MPTELIIQSNQYLNQFKNGATFSSSTSDVTYNLAGTVMEKLQYTSTIDVSWSYIASANAPVYWEDLGANLFRFKKSNGSFIDDGFAIGDNLDWIFDISGATYTRDGDITIIQNDWMYVQFSTSTVFSTLTGSASQSEFWGKSSLDAIIYSFGLIDNSENFNTNSKVSGNNQAYYASALVVGVPQTMTKQGTYQDWITGSITCEKQTNPSTYVQRYELIHNFIVNPYYLDGELANLTGGIAPDLYSGSNSLKHVVGIDLRTGLSNPNTSKTATMENILGSTGYFGENFNGFNNVYGLTNPTYEDSSAVSADGILTGEETTIRVTITKSGGSFVSTDKVGAFVSLLPTSVDYTDKTTDFETNFIYDNLYCLADGVPVTQASSFIDEVTATVNAGDIDLVIKTTLSTAQQIYLASMTNPYFLLAIQAGDVTLSNVNSDRVMLVADALPFDTSPDITGLFTVNDFRIFTHDDTIGTDSGFTDLDGWNEDGIACTFDFDLDLNKNALLNSLELKLVAYNTVTFESFDLDSYDFQLGSTISGGVQQFNISDSRAYTLASGSQFNDVTLVTGAQAAGFQNYTGTFSQKISWKEWIKNLAADTVFYDSTEPNDNLNYKASNYVDLNDYVIRFMFDADVYGEDSTLGTSGNTNYKVLTNNLTTYDYDLDSTPSTPRYTGTIETFTEDGVTNLGGAILTNGDNTLVKTTWVDNLYSFVSFWDFYAIHRLEPQNAQGYAIEELSSINTPPTGQLIQPIVGNTLLGLQIVAGDLITSSLIDGSTVNPGVNYKLSSRIQSPNKKSTVKKLTFFHKKRYSANFILILTKTGDTAQWDYGDGTALDTTNSTNHVYIGAKGEWMVVANVFDYNSITALNAYDCQLQGYFSWTPLNNVTSFIMSYCVDLTNIYNPTTSTVMTMYDLQWNGCTTVDVSGLTGLGGVFTVTNSLSLTTLIMPASTQTFSNFDCSVCDLDYFDLTPLTNLTESTSATIDLSDNSMTAEEVNHFLVDLDSMSTGGFATRVITIDGTNAAPDGTSGGYDGLTAKANLIAKTFTVNTN